MEWASPVISEADLRTVAQLFAAAGGADGDAAAVFDAHVVAAVEEGARARPLPPPPHGRRALAAGGGDGARDGEGDAVAGALAGLQATVTRLRLLDVARMRLATRGDGGAGDADPATTTAMRLLTEYAQGHAAISEFVAKLAAAVEAERRDAVAVVAVSLGGDGGDAVASPLTRAVDTVAHEAAPGRHTAVAADAAPAPAVVAAGRDAVDMAHLPSGAHCAAALEAALAKFGGGQPAPPLPSPPSFVPAARAAPAQDGPALASLRV